VNRRFADGVEKTHVELVVVFFQRVVAVVVNEFDNGGELVRFGEAVQTIVTTADLNQPAAASQSAQ